MNELENGDSKLPDKHITYSIIGILANLGILIIVILLEMQTCISQIVIYRKVNY